MRKKPLAIIGVVAAVAVTAIAAVGLWGFGTRGRAEVVTVAAQVTDIERTVSATGILQPAEVVSVGSEQAGLIVAMHVKLGDIVQRGDLIAVVDPVRLQNQISRDENNIRQARSRLESAKNNLRLAEMNLLREQYLHERGMANLQRLQQLSNQVTNARNSIEEREADLKIDEIELENARKELDEANIRAPMSGVVAEIVAREGQVINTNRQVPVIVKLAKTDTMQVRAQVSEADILHIEAGQPVYFTILGDPSRRFEARLLAKEFVPAGGGLEVNSGARAENAVYYNVLFEVENPDGVLFPGMTADVRIVLGRAQGVLAVPAAAVVAASPEAARIQVVQPDGSIAEREVTLGLTTSDLVEVVAGLEPGEQVVLGAGVESAAQPSAGGGLMGALPLPTS